MISNESGKARINKVFFDGYKYDVKFIHMCKMAGLKLAIIAFLTTVSPN
jgi:hypothetical protein